MADLSLVGLVELVNHAYVGYPGAFTPEGLPGYAEFVRVQSIDLARSVLARDGEGAPIGLGLLGMRGGRGWCGEFGVVPEWRRRGVGRALLAALLSSAHEAGLYEVQLEVSQANTPARRLYESAGFRLERTLHNFAATVAELELPSLPPPDRLRITPVEIAEEISGVETALTGTPAWDHEIASLLAATGTRSLTARRSPGYSGGMIVYATPTPDDLEIRALVTIPPDLEMVRMVLAATGARDSVRMLAAYVTEESRLFEQLPAVGFHELEPDLEMVRVAGKS
ncbi:MAG: GNAT family N-acetyltransferase [Chloroflexia bacterium]